LLLAVLITFGVSHGRAALLLEKVRAAVAKTVRVAPAAAAHLQRHSCFCYPDHEHLDFGVADVFLQGVAMLVRRDYLTSALLYVLCWLWQSCCSALHSYYKLMYNMAKQGNPHAQKEYGAWLKKLDKAKKAYKEAYDNEEIETMAGYGYEVSNVTVTFQRPLEASCQQGCNLVAQVYRSFWPDLK
jgi:hypothetical protein